jgi:hypothetical protein
MNVQVNFTAKWQLKGNEKYRWTTCRRLINCQTGRIINKSIKGSQVGYWIGKEFIKLSDLKSRIELIPKQKTPF